VGIGGWGFEGIFRHEAGHFWNAGHGCPPENGYIMCGESIPAFSWYHIPTMRAHRDSRTCLEEIPYDGPPEPPFVRPDPVSVVAGEGPVAVAAAASDTDRDCDIPVLSGRPAASAFGAGLLVLDPDRAGDPQGILWVPRTGLMGIDSFPYAILDGAGGEIAGTALVEVRSRGLVLHLPLDETDGDEAADASGRGHDGELRGDKTFAERTVAGRYGTALAFEGIDGEHVSVEDHEDLGGTRGITVSAWFRLDAASADGATLVAKGGDSWRLKRDGTTARLKFSGTGLTVAGGGTPEARGSTAVADGAWHHAAGVFDGSRLALYIDGALDAAVPVSGRIAGNGSTVHVGGDGWIGAADDVRIHGLGLDAAAVRLLFRGGRIEDPRPADGEPGVVPGAVLSWTAAPAADAYDIYLGRDRAAVAAAGLASPEYAGRRTTPSHAPALDLDGTYFWRVDPVVGGSPEAGDVRGFSTAFAFTDFREPAMGSASYTPKPGARELGFRTVSEETGGQDPLAGTVETSSTSTSPVLSHRSIRATTTIGPVDLEGRPGTAVAVTLQARDTGYEAEDLLEVEATDGAERIPLLRLSGAADLAQRSGAGYADHAALLPGTWKQASLVLTTSSDSSAGSERYDFDRVRFFCLRTFPVLAECRFDEASPGAASHAAAAGETEIGFRTVWTATSGAGPTAAVKEHAGGVLSSRFLSLVSVRSTTTFDRVDLAGRGPARATAVVRARATGYEAEDLLEIWATDGKDRVDLIRANGDTGLDGLATGSYESYSAEIPGAWTGVSVVIETSSNSSAGSEGFDVRLVEIAGAGAGGCDGEVTAARFRRGDANGDGSTDLADGLAVLFHLFEGTSIPCGDAADADDDGSLRITDAVRVLAHLFTGGQAPPAPYAACGEDPTGDGLGCEIPPCR